MVRMGLAVGVLLMLAGGTDASSLRLQSHEVEDLARILHGSRPAPHLLCRLVVREIRQQRKFSTGTRWVEMIEVEYKNPRAYARSQMKAYFPVGMTKITRKETVSQFSGPVEEIILESEDRLGQTLTFQHDGRGQAVWMMMHDELMVNPCQLK